MNITDEEIMELFFQVARNRGNPITNSSSNSNSYMGQYRCMYYLEVLKNDTVNQKNLAEIMQIRPASLSELLGKLERKGYVKRSASDADKRNILVSLTEDGFHAMTKRRRQDAKMHTSQLAVLTEEEKQQFYHILQKLQPAANKGEHNV